MVPAPATAAAQPAAPSHAQVISISPLFAMFGFYSAEFERRITTTTTAAVSGSAFELGPFGYRSLDAKVRFYPGERALEGLAIGLSAGKVWLSADAGGLFFDNTTGSGVIVGSEASYSWLTGKRRNVAFGIGGGLKRILRYGGEDVSSVHITYPTARASLGFAF